MTVLPPGADAIADALRADGYFALPPVIAPALVARCHAAVARARAAGVATVAAYVDDAAWELAVAVAPIAAAALGTAVTRQPAYWAWWIEHDGLSRGWGPHRDNPDAELLPDGGAPGVTVWIPMTDATVDNGCMYLVPAPWDLEYQSRHPTSEVVWPQAVRAVPAVAGAVLGWTPRLLHWGAMARAGAPPRVSYSFEFQRAELPPLDGPPAPADHIPPRDTRAALVLEQWDRYRHMHEQPDLARATLTDYLRQHP